MTNATTVAFDELHEYVGLNRLTIAAWVRDRENLPAPIGGWCQKPHRWDLRTILEWNTARFQQQGILSKTKWGIRTARLEETDAWGRRHQVAIEWLPEDITWTDPAHENAGRLLLAHGDPGDPPAQLRRGQFGHVGSVRATRTSTRGEVVEFREVEEPGELEPGTFRVLPDLRCPARDCRGHY